MALRGDLASVDLAQVFQMLALNQKVGLLSIQSRKSWKVLAFDHRGVTVHHNVHAVLERVVASFVRSRRLDEDALEDVRDHAARTGQELTDGLLAGGYLEPIELEEQYRAELEEEIYDLFFCREARFEFYEGADQIEGFDGHTDDRFFFHCDSIVMEAARRIDEWAYIVERVPSNDMFFVAAVESIDVADFGDEGAALFELLDGRRSVQRLIDLTGLQSFQACKAVAQLLDAGAIAPLADDELVDLAVECESEDRLVDAINLFERAASLGVGLPGVHSLAAGAYRASERYADAARHIEAGAELLAAQGDLAGAAAQLLEVSRMLPSALGVRERLVELTVDAQFELPDFDPMQEGKEVVELLLEFGDVERVRRMLELLLHVAPTDIELKKALVSVHLKAGDQQRVAELYESIADDLVDLGHPLEAVGYLQKILLMDRGRADISERVRGLYEHDERSRRRSRLLGVLGTLFCLLVGVGTFYWFYDERAETDLALINVAELLEHDDFAGAAMAYTEFLRKYPLTTSVAAAEAELQQIEAARQRFEARRATERAVQERELQRIRTNYRREWEQHRALFLEGKPEQSLEMLEHVRELIAVAGAQPDVEWALEQQVEHSWQRMRDYLAAADRLAQEYDAAAAAQDWDKVRRTALELKSDYENTAAAARVAVPVMVRTRPAGARLLHDGKLLEKVVDGRAQALVTPTVILCAEAAADFEIVTELEGFEPGSLTFVPREQSVLDLVLAVVPANRIDFGAKLQTGIGVGEGWLAAGIRGGRLGIARVDGSALRVVELEGLRAVASTPHLQGGRAFFVSNENTIECFELATGGAAKGWPVPLPNGAATELLADGGRLTIVDGESVLHCWEQDTGAHLWSLALGSAPSGPPTLHRRQLVIGTVDGRVFIVDAADGKPEGVLRSGAGLSTRVLNDGPMMVFGCVNGDIRAVDRRTGRVLWDIHAGRSVADGMLALGADSICAVVGDRLVFWSRHDGSELGRTELDGDAQTGLEVRGPRAYLRLRRPKLRNLPARDVLQAIDVASRAVLWEFAADGVHPRTFGCDERTAAFAATDDSVVVFR
ncbi:MAG: PQQ-binding-like beta-propeller repeat protein [Planctomycetes bacterium]|nr:PQQ-binding-like beta-propeller repeat protein [Planctomycetota bacterium]